VHIVYQTAAADFEKALKYLNANEDVAFTCICGDLTDDGTATQLAQYKAVVDAHSPDTPVYAIAGNHEAYDGTPVTTEKIQPYTGQPFYYSFMHSDDVFIMCGCYTANAGQIFTTEELQWLYETLETNRNKRCFVFQHVFPWGDSGNALNGYQYGNLFAGTKGDVFKSLMQHYKNTVFFHGHSHFKFYLQERDKKANYSAAFGYRSVHIPSLAVPRDLVDGTLKEIYADSEGYVVDVYSDGIHLRGRDFVKGEFLPIASYWLDTTLQTIEPGTYKDSTGTIITQ
jgi:predicted phosphodiesterase